MKKFLLSFFTIITSIIFAFFIFEKFLIWENYYQPYPNPTKKNINGINYTFLFDKPIDETKKQVYVIGDSFTEGASCAYKKKNLTSYLGREFKQDNYQFVNLGSSGKSLPNYIDFVNNFNITPYDKVLLILYDNDIGFSHEMCSISVRHKKELGLISPNICLPVLENDKNISANNSIIRKANNYFKKYLTFKMIKEALSQFSFFRKIMYRNELQNLWIDFDSDENKYIIASIIYIENLVQKKGADFYLTYFPNVNNITKNDYRHELWKSFLKNLNNVYNINSFDPYPYFIVNSPQRNMVWSLTDNHPDCDAHKLMSDYVKSINIF